MEPDESRLRESDEEQALSPTSDAQSARKKTEQVLLAPHLPTLLLSRIQQSDMLDTHGQDLKQKALDLCREIDALLLRIHSISELPESAQVIKEETRKLSGDELYGGIGRSLKTAERMIHVIARRSTGYWSYDYLLNTNDNPHTPRTDMEAVIALFHEMKPLDTQIRNLGFSELIDEYDEKSVDTMNKTRSHYVARNIIQRELEEKIGQILKEGVSDKESAQLILTTTSMQMETAHNVIAQSGSLLNLRLDDCDLGYNEAEKRLYLLEIFQKVLGGMEGIKFIGRFY